MDMYYVVGVTAISHPKFGVIINIVSKVDNSYRVAIGDILQCICLDFIKMSFMALGNKGKWVHCKHLYYVYRWITQATS